MFYFVFQGALLQDLFSTGTSNRFNANETVSCSVFNDQTVRRTRCRGSWPRPPFSPSPLTTRRRWVGCQRPRPLRRRSGWWPRQTTAAAGEIPSSNPSRRSLFKKKKDSWQNLYLVSYNCLPLNLWRHEIIQIVLLLGIKTNLSY